MKRVALRILAGMTCVGVGVVGTLAYAVYDMYRTMEVGENP